MAYWAACRAELCTLRRRSLCLSRIMAEGRTWRFSKAPVLALSPISDCYRVEASCERRTVRVSERLLTVAHLWPDDSPGLRM
jgi:hypothetical protein